MVSRKEELTISKQCELLNVTRSRVYYTPRTKSKLDLKIMRLIDELYQEHPTMGSRSMSKEITKTHHIKLGRLKARRLMREMCISAIYPKKNLSIPNSGHKIYPYLLTKKSCD